MTAPEQPHQPTTEASGRLSAWITPPKRLTVEELTEIRQAFIDSPEGKSLMRDGVRGLLAEIDYYEAQWVDCNVGMDQEYIRAEQAEARARVLEAALMEADQAINGSDRDYVIVTTAEIIRQALAAASTPATDQQVGDVDRRPMHHEFDQGCFWTCNVCGRFEREHKPSATAPQPRPEEG